VHITLPGKDIIMALKVANALVTIVIDGDEEMAMLKSLQRDATDPIEHFDLVIIRKGQEHTVQVPVDVKAEAVPETLGTGDSQTIDFDVEATTHIRARNTACVESLDAGTQIKASEPLRTGRPTLVVEAETMVINFTRPHTERTRAEAAARVEEEREAEAPGGKADGTAEGEGRRPQSKGPDRTTSGIPSAIHRDRRRLSHVLLAQPVEAKLTQRMLFAGTAVVVGLYLLIEAVDPLGHVGGLRALVDLGGRANIPDWWNSLLLGLVAVTAFAARATPAQERVERRAWAWTHWGDNEWGTRAVGACRRAQF
jgi:large subunit ribosomal protein L25